MCWADCPALQPFSCTVGCASSFESCTDAIVEIVESVLSFITSLVKLITTGGTSLLLDVAKGALKGVVKEVADASLCALGVDLHISAIEPHLTNDIIDHVANAIKNITKDVRQSLRGELETVLVEKYGPAITEHVLGMAASHLAVASIMPEEVMDLEPACTNSMTRAILHKSYNKLDMTLDIAEAMDPVGLVAMIRTFTQYGKCPSAALPQSCAEADNACGGGTCSETHRWECATCGNKSLVGPACVSEQALFVAPTTSTSPATPPTASTPPAASVSRGNSAEVKASSTSLADHGKGSSIIAVAVCVSVGAVLLLVAAVVFVLRRKRQVETATPDDDVLFLLPEAGNGADNVYESTASAYSNPAFSTAR